MVDKEWFLIWMKEKIVIKIYSELAKRVLITIHINIQSRRKLEKSLSN